MSRSPARRGPVAAAALLLALAALALGLPAPRASAAPHGITLGLAGESFASPDAALREGSLATAREAGARLASLAVSWTRIAPAHPPAGFDAANPADPAYDWASLDASVRGAVAHGLRPLFGIDFAPSWAEGPGRPSTAVAPRGSWLPQPAQLGLFAAALAARYSGRFVDPADPAAGPLPRVRYFEVWAEQNLAERLSPQWRGRRLVGPAHYRAMLDAAYASIHRADPAARVIVGGLAPYGDARAGGDRVPPVWFWRSLLCLRGPRLRPLPCPHPARFDIAAHNPIDVEGPDRGALGPLDASTPDIGRLSAIVRRGVATGRALPARPKPFWAPEIWWDSNPPDPGGVPLGRQARYLSEALYRLWRQGVGAVVWWYLRDRDPGPAGFAATLQSGLLFRDGSPKPSYRAFRFPFVAHRAGSGRGTVWGLAPQGGPVVVERRTAAGWTPVARLAASANRVFAGRLSAPRPLLLRARQAGVVSPPWRLR